LTVIFEKAPLFFGFRLSQLYKNRRKKSTAAPKMRLFLNKIICNYNTCDYIITVYQNRQMACLCGF